MYRNPRLFLILMLASVCAGPALADTDPGDTQAPGSSDTNDDWT